MSPLKSRTKFSKKFNAGLTLAELLVSIVIIGLITSVVVFNYRDFNDNLEIGNLAYDLALSIRDAQVSGGAVRGFGGGFDYAYGVHFNISFQQPDFMGDNKSYINFIDLYPSNTIPPGNGEYDANLGGYPGFLSCGEAQNLECLQIIDIGRGNFIEKICYRNVNGNLQCNNVGSADLTFLRPKLETNLIFRRENGNPINQAKNKEAVICLASPSGRQKSIHILKTGQISVEDECL